MEPLLAATALHILFSMPILHWRIQSRDNDDIICLCSRPADHKVAFGSSTGKVQLYCLTDKSENVFRHPKLDRATAVAMSSDGKLLAAGGMDDSRTAGCIAIWTTKEGSEYRYIGGFSGAVHELFFVPDGKFIVARVSGEDDIKIIDTMTGRALKPLKCRLPSCASVAAGSATIAVGNKNGEARLTNVIDSPLFSKSSRSWVSSVAVTSDSNELVVAKRSQSTRNALVQVFDRKAGGMRECRTDFYFISHVVLSPSDKVFAIVGYRLLDTGPRFGIRIHDRASLKELRSIELEEGAGEIRSLAFVSENSVFFCAAGREVHQLLWFPRHFLSK
jgi:WD40 repeat protein